MLKDATTEDLEPAHCHSNLCVPIQGQVLLEHPGNKLQCWAKCSDQQQWFYTAMLHHAAVHPRWTILPYTNSLNTMDPVFGMLFSLFAYCFTLSQVEFLPSSVTVSKSWHLTPVLCILLLKEFSVFSFSREGYRKVISPRTHLSSEWKPCSCEWNPAMLNYFHVKQSAVKQTKFHIWQYP